MTTNKGQIMTRTCKLTAAIISLLTYFTLSPVNADIRTMAPLIIQESASAPIMLVITNNDAAEISGDLTFESDSVKTKSAVSSLSLKPGDWKIVKADASLNPGSATGKVTCRFGKSSADVTVVRGINLASLTWYRLYTPRTLGPDPKLMDTADPGKWSVIHPPTIWEDTNYAWCKVEFVIPETWKGNNLSFIAGAIDDNDVTYFNGQEIGRTDGWDLRRQYTIPASLIKWGEENTLIVMADNFGSGGGLTREPLMIVPDGVDLQAKNDKPSQPMSRPKPGIVGKPLPLRQIHIDNGVLRYPDGNEVALWGVNYYPHSWYQFDNMMKLKIDMKSTIRTDLDHMKQMGIEVIRIHVFDREITDGKGNILPNIHLDLLDYLVSECSRRGIYMYFTPIAWWGGPNEVKGAFSQATSKPGMMFVPDAKTAAVNYLRQFMTKKNPYTGLSYKDEPCVCFFEVMNEPNYFMYGDLQGSFYTPQGESPELLEHDRAILRELWSKWLSGYGLSDSSEYFPVFRYDLMRQYIREMVGAIRSTGAKQPIAINFGLNGDELVQAIADSECDAITYGAYPGGLRNQVDGINLLPLMRNMGTGGKVNLPYYDTSFDGRLDKKARVSYEFDADGTNSGSYMYPAIAASFRSGGCQIAAQFQYDSVATARWNTDWGTHWLNWLYTPSKSASFMLAGEAFHRIPREIRYKDPGTELVVGPMATSFEHNQSILSTPDTVIYSRTISDWKPLKMPVSPAKIVGTGSSQYVSYGGTGIYKIETIGKDTLRLTVNPDARQLGDLMKGSLSTSVAELEENVHWFKLKLPGWDKARCVEGKSGKPVKSLDGGWLVRPGVYKIYKR
ncbi:MAG: glycoside hydrolase 5 family protein [Armatimonadota bacterium]